MDVLLAWPGGIWESSARLLGGLMMAYLLIMWIASILWVRRDIQSRTTDPVSHLIGVAIAVVFPIVGLPIYFIVRPTDTLMAAYDRQLEQEALLAELQTVSACPNCRRPVQDEFTVCAFCATPVNLGCIRCGHQLRLPWRFCPYCATPRAQTQLTQAQPLESRRLADDGEPAPSRVSASREAALDAIRRAAGRAPGDAAGEAGGEAGGDAGREDAPRVRRPAGDVGEAAPRPRPRADSER